MTNKNIKNELSDLISHIDLVLKEQKEIAHSAIDMPDWDEGQKVLIETNKNISAINSWKNDLKDILNKMQDADFLSYKVKEDESKQTTVDFEDVNKAEHSSLSKNEDIKSNNEKISTNNNISITKESVNAEEEKVPFPEDTDKIQWKDIDFDFTSEKVIKMFFENKIYDTENLSDAFVKICDYLYQKNPELFKQMLSAPFNYGRKKRTIETYMYSHRYKKLTHGDFYVNTCSDCNYKIEFIKDMLHYFSIYKDSIMFGIKVSGYDDFDNEEFESLYSIINKKSEDKKEETNKAEETVENTSDIISFCEQMIIKHPFLMAVIFAENEFYNNFNSNENQAKTNMQIPKQLSNGIWIETEMTNIQKLNLIKRIKRYCHED